MEIKIKTGEELSNLFKGLSDDIVEADFYHRIYCDIASATKNNMRAFDQSNTFWTLAMNAFHDAKIIRLCRVYDQESSSLSLVNLLKTIKSNLHLFTREHFRDRLKNSEYVDSLADRDRIPSEQELEEDIAYSSIKSNPLIKKLMKWRHHLIAHRAANVSLGEVGVLKNNPISSTEIEDLLDKGFAIYNHYSSLFTASTETKQLCGHDDYKSLLNLINLGLDKWDENIYGTEGQGNNLIVRKASGLRSGWDEAFSLMAERNDDRLLDESDTTAGDQT